MGAVRFRSGGRHCSAGPHLHRDGRLDGNGLNDGGTVSRAKVLAQQLEERENRPPDRTRTWLTLPWTGQVQIVEVPLYYPR